MHTSDAWSQKYSVWLTEVVPSLHQASSSDESQYSSYLICTLFRISPYIFHFIHSYYISFSHHFHKYLPHLYILAFKNTSRGFNQKKYCCKLDVFTFFSLPSHGKTNTFHAEINQIQQSFDSSALASSFTASSITNKSWWLVRHWRIDMAVCQ